MINFQHGDYLYFAGLIPVLVLMWLLNRRRQIKLYSLLGDRKLVNKLTNITPLHIQLIRFGLFILAVFSMIVALSQPYIMGVDSNEQQISAADIVFVVDVSKSMYVKDTAPDRLSRAKHIIKDIVDNLAGEQAGIVVFAGKANMFVPLTNDYYYINKSVNELTGNLVQQQGTSLREALKISGLTYTPNAKHAKVLCLMSDGEFHDKNALGLADSLRKAGLNIFSFGFGTDQGGDVPLTTRVDEENSEIDKNGKPIISHLHSRELLAIAGNSASNYFPVAYKLNAVSLFLAQLQKAEYNKPSRSLRQYYWLFLLAAVVLLAAEGFIPQAKKEKNLN